MKSDPKLVSKFAILIMKTYSNAKSLADVPDGSGCLFVGYNLGQLQKNNNKDPARQLYFSHIADGAEENNFLLAATDLINLAIETFKLVVEKDKKESQGLTSVRNALIRVQSAQILFERLESLYKPLSVVPTSDQLATVYFGYRILPDNEEYSSDIHAAICDFFQIVYLPFSWLQQNNESKLGGRTSQGGDDKRRTQFPNSKQLVIGSQFAIAKPIADTYTYIMKEADEEEAISQYSASRATRYTPPRKDSVSLDIDPAILSKKAANNFAEKLMGVKSAKILQTFCAIWKYSNIQDSYKFRDVKISEIMAICLKKGDKTNFSKEDRQEFTKALKYLAALTINLQAPVGRVENGKKKRALAVEQGVRLLRLREYYALKKEFQNLPDDQLDPDIHYDKTVISRFDGELLPNYNQSFNGIANIYSDMLLQLDANKDQRAVILGFTLQTRFNQNPDKRKPVTYDRGYLIEQCGYQKSDKAKPAVATKQLKNVLDKLKASGIISGYENLTNNNADKVNIFPYTQLDSLTNS